MLVEEAVEGVFGAPVVRGHHVVLEFTVVAGFRVVPPQAVTRLGLQVDVIVVGVALGTFVVQRRIDVALPGQVFDQRLGLHDLLDAGQFDGFRRVAIGQGDLSRLRGMQGFGALTRHRVFLDQQLLVAFQGRDLFPIQRDRTTVIGFQQQFAAIEEFDLAAQAITVFQPDGIGQERGCGH
ncbi:hypothetical protein D9M68_583800 [compost metagenome]